MTAIFARVFYRQANWLIVLLVLSINSITSNVVAQRPGQHSATDSTSLKIVDTIKKIIEKEAQKNKTQYQADRAIILRDELFEKINHNIQSAKNYLKKGINTTGIHAEMEEMNRMYSVVGDGIFTNKGTVQTHRNLAASYKILFELLKRSSVRKSQADSYLKNLLKFRHTIDSLTGDSLMYSISPDTASLRNFAQKLIVINAEYSPVDSVLKQAIVDVQRLREEINQVVNMLSMGLDEIEGYDKELSNKTFDREVANLGVVVNNERPFKEITDFSRAKEKLSFLFYVQNHLGKIFLLTLLVGLATIFLNTLKQKVRKENFLHGDFSGQLVLRYPLLSAVIIILNLFQFIFPDPPFIFNCLFWIISAGCLTIIFLKFISRYWMYFWLAMLLLFMLACADNLILQESRVERWGMLLLSVAGVLVGGFALLKGHRDQLREKAILYFIRFVVIVELASIIANLFGRYNLSKSLLTSGYISVIIAILFLWTIRLINESLSLASDVYQAPERKLFYINFDIVGKRAPYAFYVFLVVGWFILFARNFYAYKLIVEPFNDFLIAERSMGEYSFTFKSVLVFFLILIISTIISRIVSFFASDKHPLHADSDQARRPGLGSWLLLIRISIIIMGLLLAFAAAGVPLDRVTIIMGALGVGIGFGLQAIVNNLVSGIIIAFEKPVNVGDLIEVKGMSGTMKSIGFRSSVLLTAEGSNVIIPNGDLLNTHLVNWTQEKGIRRAEIMVSIANGTDLEIAQQKLNELLVSHDKILKYPAPAVLAKDFGSNSIELQLFFWIRVSTNVGSVKSDLIFSIQKVFMESGIEIL